MTSDVQVIPGNPLAEYWSEAEMARARGKTMRTLRDERQRGVGPPYVRDGRTIRYHVPGYGEWLKAGIQQPVRGPMASAAKAIA